MAADKDPGAGKRSTLPGDSDYAERSGYLYEGSSLVGVDELKQTRRLEAIDDARNMVLERRDKALDFFWQGQIQRQTFQKAIRVAVEKYLYQSEWSIRNHKYNQWFWAGEPPTRSGRSPYDDDGNMRAILPPEDMRECPFCTEEITRDYRFKEHWAECEQNEGGWDVDDIQSPILVTDDDGNPPFGTEPNVLGVMPMPEVEKKMTFIGLDSFMNADDPIIRATTVESDHPTKIKERQQERFEYQVPTDVSMAAFSQVNEFWERFGGMDLDIDRGQTIIEDFDMSDKPKYRKTDGRPEV